MRFHLITCILLATSLVGANGQIGDFITSMTGKVTETIGHVVRRVADTIHTKPASKCTIPEPPHGARFIKGSCTGSCNIQPGEEVDHGSSFTYRCETGYIMSGSDVSVCSNGVWKRSPTCTKTCSPLLMETVVTSCNLYGKVVPCDSDILPGTIAVLTCKDFYIRIPTENSGHELLICLPGGMWNHLPLRCRPGFYDFVLHGIPPRNSGEPTWQSGIFPRNNISQNLIE